MDEIYEMIEAKIKSAGCLKEISGEDIYNDICDQIEGKENGTYMVLSKFAEDIIMEYTITVMDEDFNLSKITIRTDGNIYNVDLDN